MYDSAEVHTKQDKRKPLSFYASIIAVIVAVILVSFVVVRMNSKLHPVSDVSTQERGGGNYSISANLKTAQRDPADRVAFEVAHGVHLPTYSIDIMTGASS
jgi:hypothetical protein